MPELPAPFVVLWIALALDVLVGDPPNALHPVAWLGRVIGWFYRHAPKQGRAMPFFAGTLFVACGVVAGAALGVGLEFWTRWLPQPLNLIVQAMVLKLTFSVRGLVRAGHAVLSPLAGGDLA